MCGCTSNTATAQAPTAWTVYAQGGTALGSYRTEVEAATAAARTPGATYRPDRV